MSASYDPVLVAISLVVAIFAAWTALDMAGRVTAAGGRARWAWMAGGSLAMGVGIWSMHFVGMLAFRMPVAVEYHLGLVLLSGVCAVLASLLALRVVSRPVLTKSAVAAGALLMGPAIAGMHYIGMAAMRLPARIAYDPLLWTLSVAIAVVVSGVALLLAFRFRSESARRGRILSAVLMGLAVAGMHYTGMAAARFTPQGGPAVSHSHVLPPIGMVVGIVLATTLVLGIALIGAVVDRRIHTHFIEPLLASEARFRSLTSSAPIGMFHTDSSGLCLYVNDEWQRIAGLSLEDALGHGWQCAVHPDDAELVAREWTHCLRTGTAIAWEFRFLRPSGEVRRVEARATPVPGPDGTAADWVGTTQDITERHLAEQRIREAEERYREIVEEAVDLVWQIDVEGSWTFLNGAAERIYGIAPAELIGTPLIERTHPDYVQSDRTMFACVLAGATLADHESLHLDVNGVGRRLSTTARPIRDVQGMVVGIRGIARDVTEQAAARATLETARDVAQRAVAAKSAFLANMSHEIRTPMNGILGMVSLLSGTTLSSEQRRSIEVISESGEALLRIINDILDLSKIEAGFFELEDEPLDLHGLVEGLTLMFGPRAQERGLELALDVATGVPRVVRGDAHRLRQVLTNLVGNALKFTHEGRVVLALQRCVEDGEPALCFAVTDTGIGMSPEQLAIIFEPFGQADGSTTRRYGGTGLGLSISRRLVRLMGGEIRVSSQVGSGSTFRFSVPLVHAAMPAAEPAPADTAPRPHRPLRILLAEDNPVNQEVASSMLKKRGHIVRIENDGLRAVEAARSEPFDVILMDIQMPLMDGFEATRRIRALPAERHVPIIALTANVMPGERERCVQLGMDAYLAKPFRAHELFAMVESWDPDASAPPRPAVDVEAFRAMLRESGIEESCDTLLGVFAGEAPRDLASLEAAVLRSDARDVVTAAQSFASAARLIHALPLADRLDAIATAAETGEWARVEQAFPAVRSAVADAITAVTPEAAGRTA